jgi:hypothetical protein
MKKHLLSALIILSVASLGTPVIGQTPTFKVEKFDIKGDGGITSPSNRPPAACLSRVAPT